MPAGQSPEHMRKIGVKKGEVRNPNGRPKGLMDRRGAFAWLLNDAHIAEIMGQDVKKAEEYARKVGVPKCISRVQMLSTVAYKKAMGGDTRAMELIFDALFGKPTQLIGGDPENPIDLSPKVYISSEVLKQTDA